MWSFGRYALKLSDAEFWRLNPRKFAALQKRHHEENVRSERLAGIIAATFVNHSMSPPEKAAEAWRFMPSNWGKEEQIEEQLADQAIGRTLMALTRIGK